MKIIGILESKGNSIVDQRQGRQSWENYITELYGRANRPENLEVETEDELEKEEKVPYGVHSEVGKAVKMRTRRQPAMMTYLEMHSKCWEKISK